MRKSHHSFIPTSLALQRSTPHDLQVFVSLPALLHPLPSPDLAPGHALLSLAVKAPGQLVSLASLPLLGVFVGSPWLGLPLSVFHTFPFPGPGRLSGSGPAVSFSQQSWSSISNCSCSRLLIPTSNCWPRACSRGRGRAEHRAICSSQPWCAGGRQALWVLIPGPCHRCPSQLSYIEVNPTELVILSNYAEGGPL